MPNIETSLGRNTSVLLVDHRPVVLRGLRSLIDEQPDFVVVGEAACPDSAIEALNALRPEIALVLHCPPDLDGLDLIRRMRLTRIDARVALRGAHVRPQDSIVAHRLEVDGFLAETASEADLINCLSALSARTRWEPASGLAGSESLPPELSPRQREVAALVAKGLSNKQIATELMLAEGTVKLHLNRIFRRLGIGNRTALAAMIPR